ncbi:hypothetical protein FHX81_1378 [Saccharothrix saharensis]|uniref:DUF5709 domain-containing protein n=1 Tax=Saccharothrix saharensis TaxID=571190 RepID=A0A543J8D8_9PSEU|nr:hypothetical protein [Saccharothrix saharensis]TQM79084.1 hypothetical protein FHX81_1378 [Saccharothrix saharensis]
MADEHTYRAPMSEQQEELEPGWGTTHSAPATGSSGHQYTAPDDRGDLTDDEPTSIADEAGFDHLLGPEDAAMHVEDEDGRPAE